MLGDDCYRPTRELPYGRQRLLEIALALATRPKVLLLDEPAAGVPRDESAELFEVDLQPVARHHGAVHRARHELRVPVCQPHHRDGRRAHPARRHAGRDRRRSARARGLSRQVAMARIMAEPLLALDDVRAGYGDAVVLDGISLEVPGARQPRGARPQRRRQVDAAAHHHGLHPGDARRGCAGAARTSPARPPHRRARARARLGRAGARDFSLAHAWRRTSPWRRVPAAGT